LRTSPQYVYLQVLTQDSASFDVIGSNQVLDPRISSREYIPGMNGVAVASRVPLNVFEFTSGQKISVNGRIEMKLVESGVFDRRLLADNGSKKLDEKASFEVSVTLAPSDMISDKGVFASSAYSNKKLESASVTLVGIMFIFFHMMW